MKKLYIIEYDDADIHSLTVADPEKKLENGNLKIINIIIGGYADELLHELTKQPEDEDE